jgi:hypothetical protein
MREEVEELGGVSPPTGFKQGQSPKRIRGRSVTLR